MMSDLIRLKTGKEIYAHNIILGIGEDLGISHGYDGTITSSNEYGYWSDLTHAEIEEVADIAIARWLYLKARAADGTLKIVRMDLS
jgi:hypothetical protein